MLYANSSVRPHRRRVGCGGRSPGEERRHSPADREAGHVEEVLHRDGLTAKCSALAELPAGGGGRLHRSGHPAGDQRRADHAPDRRVDGGCGQAHVRGLDRPGAVDPSPELRLLSPATRVRRGGRDDERGIR
jgi:hypothetical protein